MGSLADAFLPLHGRVSGLAGGAAASAALRRGSMPLLQEAK